MGFVRYIMMNMNFIINDNYKKALCTLCKNNEINRREPNILILN